MKAEEIKTGSDIKKFRSSKKPKWSQRKFGKLADITVSWVCVLETNNKELGTETLLKIEKYKDNLNKEK